MAKFVDNSKYVLNELVRKAERALTAVGLQAEGYAKLELENVPRRIDTGLLRNSITFAVSGQAPNITSYHASNPSRYGKGDVMPFGYYTGKAPKAKEGVPNVRIGTNVKYATYVHEGHRYKGRVVAPNRFIKNAISRHSHEYKEIIKSVLRS